MTTSLLRNVFAGGVWCIGPRIGPLLLVGSSAAVASFDAED